MLTQCSLSLLSMWIKHNLISFWFYIVIGRTSQCLNLYSIFSAKFQEILFGLMETPFLKNFFIPSDKGVWNSTTYPRKTVRTSFPRGSLKSAYVTPLLLVYWARIWFGHLNWSVPMRVFTNNTNKNGPLIQTLSKNVFLK